MPLINTHRSYNHKESGRGGKKISFWSIAWFKTVGMHICPFDMKVGKAILDNSFHLSYLYIEFLYVTIYNILNYTQYSYRINNELNIVSKYR